MEVFDPQTKRTLKYHKYLPGSMAHYSKDAHERLRTRWIAVDPGPEISDSEVDREENPDSSPDTSSSGDQEYADAVRCGC